MKMRIYGSKDTPQPAQTVCLPSIPHIRPSGLAGLVIVAAVAALLVTAGDARAREGMSNEDGDGWSYRVTPYVWLPTLSGDLRVEFGDPPADVDTNLLDVLDFAFLIAGEARKDRWGVLGEFNYLDLSESASTDGIVYLGAKAGLKGTMGSLAAVFRTYKGPNASLDVLVGARAWWLDLQIDYQAGSLPAKSVKKSKGWVDPMVGLRGQISVTDKVFLSGLADIGGFGLGSDWQWEAQGSVGYRFNQPVSASVGYRHLDIDLEDGGLVTNVYLSGPYLSIDFNF